MTPADIRFAKKAFTLCRYEQFTNATDAVRIATAGEHGELLAIHKENDSFTLYLRRGGKQVIEFLPAFQSRLSFNVSATADAILIPGLSQLKLHSALSESVAAFPLIFEKTGP